jgi:hypothetical protein
MGTKIMLNTAKLAKEKGFDMNVLTYYDGSEMIATQAKNPFDLKNYNLHKGSTFHSAPTQSELQKWIREKHKIDISIHRSWAMSNSYYYVVIINNDFDNLIQQDSIKDKSYEETLELALKCALENIKNLPTNVD